jgi:hypothetical protein
VRTFNSNTCGCKALPSIFQYANGQFFSLVKIQLQENNPVRNPSIENILGIQSFEILSWIFPSSLRPRAFLS